MSDAALAVATLLLVASACGSAPEASVPVDLLAQLHESRPIAVPRRIRLEPGLHAESNVQVRARDAAIYSIRLATPGRARTWFLRLFAMRNYPKALGTIKLSTGQVFETRGALDTRIELYDARGKLLSASTEAISNEGHSLGLVALCERGIRRGRELRANPRSPEPSPTRAGTLAFWALETMMRIAQNNKTLAPVMLEVVEKPSLISILTNLGVTVIISLELEHTRRVGDSFDVPFTIRANGQVALRGSIRARKTSRSLALVAGITSIAGAHPNDLKRSVHVALEQTGSVSRAIIADAVRHSPRLK